MYFAVFSILLAFWITGPNAYGDEFRSGVSVDSYANESKPQLRLDLEYHAMSEAKVGGHPKREFHFQGFYETGKNGDRSIEPDVFVLRSELDESAYFWLGRTHPLTESGVQKKISYTSAIGSQWLQNQSNALQPSVVGWIGAGAQGRVGSVFWTIAATPFYFPSFGPSTELSDHADSTGSRYARLPPQFVRINNNLIPLRFKIDTGDVKDILLQPQGLASLGWGNKNGFLRLSAWSSPTLDPEIDTNEVLRVTSNDLNVLVTAKPSFPRNNYLGFTAYSGDLPLKPEFETVYESRMKRLVFSQAINPVDFLNLGVLHTLDKPKELKESAEESPIYAKNLAWIEAAATSGRVRPGVRVERHFTKAQEDTWVRLQTKYLAAKNLEIIGNVSVIAGRDQAYFGVWRQLDSVSLGVSYLW